MGVGGEADGGGCTVGGRNTHSSAGRAVVSGCPRVMYPLYNPLTEVGLAVFELLAAIAEVSIQCQLDVTSCLGRLIATGPGRDQNSGINSTCFTPFLSLKSRFQVKQRDNAGITFSGIVEFGHHGVESAAGTTINAHTDSGTGISTGSQPQQPIPTPHSLRNHHPLINQPSLDYSCQPNLYPFPCLEEISSA